MRQQVHPDPFGDIALTAGNAALSRGQAVAAPPGGVPSLAHCRAQPTGNHLGRYDNAGSCAHTRRHSGTAAKL